MTGRARGHWEIVAEAQGPPVPRRRTAPPPRRRSHAAIPVAFVVLVAGLLLGRLWFLLPALFGLLLLTVALRFLSSRLNPFSIGFYLTVKPSGLAIGTLAVLGLVLLLVAWGDYAAGFGPLAASAAIRFP